MFFINRFKILLIRFYLQNSAVFRKGHSTQHALLNFLKNWRKCLDKSGIVGTVPMDLSKAYDCLPHDLLLAKLSAYNFD